MLLAVCVLGVLCAVLVLSLILVRRSGARRAQALSVELGEELKALRDRVDDLEQPTRDHPTAPVTAATAEFLITDLGLPPARPPTTPVRLEASTFADIVVKETVVKAASLAHGVRRGLAPATRNRIRFEMKQEVRRARKQRRADLKLAQRELHARQRRSLARDRREAS
jgi:hypothetical protein